MCMVLSAFLILQRECVYEYHLLITWTLQGFCCCLGLCVCVYVSLLTVLANILLLNMRSDWQVAITEELQTAPSELIRILIVRGIFQWFIVKLV